MFSLHIFRLAAIAAVSFFISTTIHELFHLLTGRLLGLPAVFEGLSSVGLGAVNESQFPASSLAPTLSVLLLGFLPLILLRRLKRDPSQAWWSVILAWSIVENLPYLGMQMMLLPSQSTSGVDFASISHYFGFSAGLRRFMGALGFPVFLVMIALLASFLLGRSVRSIWTGFWRQDWGWRSALGRGVILIGFGLVIFGHSMIARGVPWANGLVAVGGFIFLGLGSLILVQWDAPDLVGLKEQWIWPGIIGSVLLTPLAMIDSNDYGQMWVLLVPVMLAIAMFVSLPHQRRSR